jgi:hypothetical protein
MPEPFNARDLHIWKPDRLYRVYCGRDHIDWIRVSGQNWGLAPVLRSQLGPLGELIAGPLERRAGEKRRQAIMEADSFGPEAQMMRDQHNHRLFAVDVEATQLLAPGRGAHGTHAARWRIRMRDGSKRKLQIEEHVDLRIALHELPRIFGARLEVDPALQRTHG